MEEHREVIETVPVEIKKADPNGQHPIPAPPINVVTPVPMRMIPTKLDANPSESGEEAIRKLRAMGRRKVAIVGFSPSSYHLAPFQNDDWEVWTLNEAYTLPAVSRADRWFEIHVRDEIDVTQRDPNHIKWLRDQRSMPIYMIHGPEVFTDIPMAVKFPIEDVVIDFETSYITNTISMMIALAVQEGFTTIGIWGVDMAQPAIGGGPSEYAEQRPSCEYFIGYARGLGKGRGQKITVYIPPQSDLLASIGIYGYNTDGNHFKTKLRGRLVELQSRINGLRQQLSILEKNVAGGHAAIQEFTNTLPPDTVPMEIRERISKRVDDIAKMVNESTGMYNNMTRQMHQLEGAADDTMYYLRNWAPQMAVEDAPAKLSDRPEDDWSHLRGGALA